MSYTSSKWSEANLAALKECWGYQPIGYLLRRCRKTKTALMAKVVELGLDKLTCLPCQEINDYIVVSRRAMDVLHLEGRCDTPKEARNLMEFVRSRNHREVSVYRKVPNEDLYS